MTTTRLVAAVVLGVGLAAVPAAMALAVPNPPTVPYCPSPGPDVYPPCELSPPPVAPAP
jgi:hypothetical protein